MPISLSLVENRLDPALEIGVEDDIAARGGDFAELACSRQKILESRRVRTSYLDQKSGIPRDTMDFFDIAMLGQLHELVSFSEAGEIDMDEGEKRTPQFRSI